MTVASQAARRRTGTMTMGRIVEATPDPVTRHLPSGDSADAPGAGPLDNDDNGRLDRGAIYMPSAYQAGGENTSVTLWPPKPNELLSTRGRPPGAAGSFLGSPAAMSSSISGSCLSRLIVGGTTPSRMARIAAIASTAPAAPSRWPVIDFVEVTTDRAPSTARIARASATSPAGVEVACAFTW